MLGSLRSQLGRVSLGRTDTSVFVPPTLKSASDTPTIGVSEGTLSVAVLVTASDNPTSGIVDASSIVKTVDVSLLPPVVPPPWMRSTYPRKRFFL